MSVKKVSDIAKVPTEVLDELKPLLEAPSAFVAIGTSIYELYPVPAVKLLNIFSKLISIIAKIQDKKRALIELQLGEIDNEEELKEKEKELNDVKVTIQDILGDEDAMYNIKEILREITEGVSEEDFNQLTTGQLLTLINKTVEVNINTLPPSVKDKLFNLTSQIGIQTEANQGN